MKFYKDMYFSLNEDELEQLNMHINCFIDAVCIKHISERFGVDVLEALRMTEPQESFIIDEVSDNVIRVFKTESNKDSEGWSGLKSESTITDYLAVIDEHIACCQLLKKENENVDYPE